MENNIEKINISRIESIFLMINNYGEIETKNDKICKISKHIVDTTGKNKFLPNELKDLYNNIILNNKKNIDTETLKNIDDTLNILVKNGGTIFIYYKLSFGKILLNIILFIFGAIILYFFIVLLIVLYAHSGSSSTNFLF